MLHLSERSPLQWCFSSLGCPDLDLSQIAQLAIKHGVDSVELRCIAGCLDFTELASRERWLKQEATKLWPSEAVKITALNSSVRLSKAFTVGAREIRAFAPIMQHLDVPYLRIFDGALDLQSAPETTWAWLDQWEQLRAENDWSFDLLIETHDALFTADDVEMVFRQGHPHVHLLWDSHHTWKKLGRSPLTSWRELQPWIRHIHIKDSLTAENGKFPYTYVEPGQGEFPLLELIDQLETDAFQGPVSLEWEKQWHPNLPSLDHALLALRQLLAERPGG